MIAGPDDRHGTSALVRQAQGDASTQGRVHTLPVTEEPPHDLYPQADVFVLASAGESFGIVAAEAAAAGTPVIVSDRSGIAGFFRDGEALVVPYEREAVVEAVRRVLSDERLRERLASRRRRCRATNVVGPRHGRARGDLPRSRCAHGRDEALDRRVVTPVSCDLARMLTGGTAQLRI